MKNLKVDIMTDIEKAKEALDNLIKKSRIYLYKPIQIAEILYRDRIHGDINLAQIATYRTKSKKWRDDISRELVGRICTSSAKYQDDLFGEDAIPPILLEILGEENRKTNGAVEAYIYRLFFQKHNQLEKALNYCLEATKEDFDVKIFINSFRMEPGLKRSLDKIYEIVVYGLFSTLVNSMNMKVEISVDESRLNLLSEFADFADKVMCLDIKRLTHVQEARVYRVGVTNAADRGLDMYSNWGPAIQIKHLNLDIELAENIVTSVASDRIVIVCKDAERDIILSLLTQIGWRSRIQSIITESDLTFWYEKALRGYYSNLLGRELISTLCEEIAKEFPSVDSIPDVLKSRHYEKISDSRWL